MAEILSEVKTALRQKSTTAFDEEEIIPLIEACKLDLKRVGIKRINEEDACIRRAIVLYCKANFGYRDDSEKFERAYEKFRDSLSLSGDYNSEEEQNDE